MENVSQLYAINLGKQLSQFEKERLIPFIPPEKKERLTAFRHWQDAQRTLLGYSMASYLLAKKTGLDRESIRYKFDYYGKPTLTEKDIFFNVSHSGEWVICGISNQVIGVDVEKIQTIDLSIAEHFFASGEVHDLFTLPEEKRYDHFFKLWTLKESYIKAEGKGVSIPLHSFWFKIRENQIHFYSNSQKNWHFCLYDFDPGYKVACCVDGNVLPDEVQVLTLEDIS